MTSDAVNSGAVTSGAVTGGFVPPPYPYDRLKDLSALILERHDEVVDLSIGTPFDPPPPAVIAALSTSGTERSYPPSVGTPPLLAAARAWMLRRWNVDVPTAQIGATIGSKEMVASLPHFLRLRRPDRDTVLYPSISYPSYEMGATLAGARAVPVPFGPDGRLDLASIDPDDARRALLLWVNSPGNPTGQLDDLGAAAQWGRAAGVPVFSDECYIEFTWNGRGRTILEHGTDGVVAVHSLSKRSNLAGVRVGFYAGDAELVDYLREIRKHAGMMVPGPAQAAAVAALDDDDHVETQRNRYRGRLELLADVIEAWSGQPVTRPEGGFYLWIPVADGWEFATQLALDGGALVSPGEFYGPDGSGFVRVAVVQPDEKIAVVAERLSAR
ncbi:MAG: aminotransferase class I/II-fold pyridoxal phosphate-dependent enzyme [Ilumatobacter sp.]|uniref:aminotransferase class I/II-fold pyridoxal phosphate-dependent enzyme n=1 Tax=Ilumatobacter sp. TaxID=1967498 RepID=UPI003918B64C